LKHSITYLSLVDAAVIFEPTETGPRCSVAA
jgi:hypothetical protein